MFSVGHSNHSIEKFISLLQANKIEVVVDIRKRPYSKYNPQFNKDNLKRSLEMVGIRYSWQYWLGGGDYTEENYKEKFEESIHKTIQCSEKYITAIMCSEGDPRCTKSRDYECHRLSRITPALEARGVSVKHILPNGDVVNTPLRGLF